jgi:hypothetical protein
MMSMEFVPLAPQFGVEVQGVDLHRPPGDDEVAQLRRRTPSELSLVPIARTPVEYGGGSHGC